MKVTCTAARTGRSAYAIRRSERSDGARLSRQYEAIQQTTNFQQTTINPKTMISPKNKGEALKDTAAKGCPVEQAMHQQNARF